MPVGRYVDLLLEILLAIHGAMEKTMRFADRLSVSLTDTLSSFKNVCFAFLIQIQFNGVVKDILLCNSPAVTASPHTGDLSREACNKNTLLYQESIKSDYLRQLIVMHQPSPTVRC